MQRFVVLAVFIAAAYFYNEFVVQSGVDPDGGTAYSGPEYTDDAGWRAGQQVGGQGTVVRVLPDDNEGSRHQRFILELVSGRTVLVAHNIDLAPRIANLEPGDTVAFYGEFESNDRGGVIHWTHHDPQGRHPDGWLEHKGQRYR